MSGITVLSGDVDLEQKVVTIFGRKVAVRRVWSQQWRDSAEVSMDACAADPELLDHRPRPAARGRTVRRRRRRPSVSIHDNRRADQQSRGSGFDGPAPARGPGGSPDRLGRKQASSEARPRSAARPGTS